MRVPEVLAEQLILQPQVNHKEAGIRCLQNGCILNFLLDKMIRAHPSEFGLCFEAGSMRHATAPDLTGIWGNLVPDFCWSAAKIFHRDFSENVNDYWVALSSGACLASFVHYAAARYDPSNQTLNFNHRARQMFDSPWKLFWMPGSRRRVEDAAIGVEDLDSREGFPIFLSKKDMDILARTHPEVYDAESEAWRDVKAAAVAVSKQWSMGYTVALTDTNRANAVRSDELPHGVKCRPELLLEIDRESSYSYPRPRRMQILSFSEGVKLIDDT